METKEPNSINEAAYNPRILSEHDGKSLGRSITKFGDISGITVNTQTNTYVTGHQRMRLLGNKYQERVKIQVEPAHAPDEFGTVALGYVIVEGTNHKFPYREVSWPVELEKAANIAANRIEADWDKQKLAALDYELSQLNNADELLDLTGQTEKELEQLAESMGINNNGEEQPDEIGPDNKDSDKLEFRITREQREVIEEALGNIVATREMAAEENGSRNGSALYYMSREYLDRLHGQSDAPAA